MEKEIIELKKELLKISKLNNTLALVYWDMETKMPKNAASQRSDIIEYLSGEIFKLKTSEKMDKLLSKLSHGDNFLLDTDKRIIALAKKTFDETKKIPEDRYTSFIKTCALSFNAWQEAKEKQDFEIFKPHLKKIIDFKKEFIGYLGYEKDKYDPLLNDYEEGLTTEKLDIIFKDLKNGVLCLLEKIQRSSKKIDNSFLFGDFKKDSKEKFSKFILESLGYNFNSGRLDESMHPFTTGFGNKDIRITTNYDKKELTDAIFSCIHEGGHGIYEQDIPDSFQGTLLDSALYMSIHESQSRFYENIIGRSKDFWEYFFPFARYEFECLREKTLDEFYEAINIVTPSLIRTESDELTYNIHIIIRYEIEKDLINDRLDIDSVKDAWNKKYKDYLGVSPKNDAEGILQDMHWSDGSFGYFPSYALGNLYGAQMLNKMKKDYKNLYEDLRVGNFLKVHSWLNENVHKYGALYTPTELIKNITGEELNSKYFLEYLNNKYSKIYDLK